MDGRGRGGRLRGPAPNRERRSGLPLRPRRRRARRSRRRLGSPEEARTLGKDRGVKDYRAPNHISKTVLSTVHLGPPTGTRTSQLAPVTVHLHCGQLRGLCERDIGLKEQALSRADDLNRRAAWGCVERAGRKCSQGICSGCGYVSARIFLGLHSASIGERPA